MSLEKGSWLKYPVIVLKSTGRHLAGMHSRALIVGRGRPAGLVTSWPSALLWSHYHCITRHKLGWSCHSVIHTAVLSVVIHHGAVNQCDWCDKALSKNLKALWQEVNKHSTKITQANALMACYYLGSCIFLSLSGWYPRHRYKLTELIAHYFSFFAFEWPLSLSFRLFWAL